MKLNSREVSILRATLTPVTFTELSDIFKERIKRLDLQEKLNSMVSSGMLLRDDGRYLCTSDPVIHRMLAEAPVKYSVRKAKSVITNAITSTDKDNNDGGGKTNLSLVREVISVVPEKVRKFVIANEKEDRKVLMKKTGLSKMMINFILMAEGKTG